MVSTALTAESAWCKQLRSELQLAATTFPVVLEEDEQAFRLLRVNEGDEQHAADVVLQIEKKRIEGAATAYAELAAFVSRQSVPAIEAEPAEQPTQVHQIAARLLKPFRVHGGTIHLAGCVLEPRPFLRLTVVPESVHPAVVNERWYASDGSELSDEKVAALGLRELKAAPSRLRHGDLPNLTMWVNRCRGETTARVLATIAWCNWASGKVRISFEGGAESVPFEGWAIDFQRRTLAVPRFCCRYTGIESYDVICLDDGTVTVPEAVGVCQLTGRKVLKTQLGTCAVTGTVCLRSELEESPISQATALPEQMRQCHWCGEAVLPSELRGGECLRCAAPEPISLEELEREGILEKAPDLRQWKQLRAMRVGPLRVIKGRRHLTERAVVFDAESQRVRRRGRRRLPWGSWKIDASEA